ncbi:MAG: oxidoreductase, partial [Planktomarina sp.]
AKSGPKVHIITPAPMPTATRARFYPGEDRDALNTCASQALRIWQSMGVI